MTRDLLCRSSWMRLDPDRRSLIGNCPVTGGSASHSRRASHDDPHPSPRCSTPTERRRPPRGASARASFREYQPLPSCSQRSSNSRTKPFGAGSTPTRYLARSRMAGLPERHQAGNSFGLEPPFRHGEVTKDIRRKQAIRDGTCLEELDKPAREYLSLFLRHTCPPHTAAPYPRVTEAPRAAPLHPSLTPSLNRPPGRA